MNESVMKIENISDDKFNEMLSIGWKLISVDNFHGSRMVYNFLRIS